MKQAEVAADVFFALGDETRLSVVRKLSAGAGVAPRADGGAVERRQVRAAAERATHVTRQRAHVVPAAHGDAHRALPTDKIVAHPARLVHVDDLRQQFDRLAAVRFDVRALAADALVARRGRHLVVPADAPL